MNRVLGTFGIPSLLTLFVLVTGCGGGDDDESPIDPQYRQAMRTLVQDLSAWARGSGLATAAGFIVITQNGQELLTLNGEPDGALATDYLAAVSGVGQEDLLYGWDEDDRATPQSEREWLVGFLDRWEANEVEVLVTDYCSTPAHVNDSYARNGERGYISFAADHRELDNIPSDPTEPHGAHAGDVHTLADAENFLYLINSDAFPDKEAYITALEATNYDVLLVDAYFEGAALAATDVSRLRVKANGGARLVVSYMSIGEAEDYRYYWQSSWRASPPSWLAAENPDWPGNYKVRFWDPEWQAILFGSSDSYLGRIVAAGFDGVYLDIIDGFEYFEGT